MLPNTHYMGDVLFVVCTRACPALPQHVQGAHHVGIRFEAATFVDALENRLRRAVAFVPALTVRAGDARPSRIDGNHHTTHFQKLPFDCLAKTVEPRAQDGAVEPAFLLHILAGILNGALGGRRHVLHLQVLDVHAAVLLRERMRRLPVEILSNATNLSV